MSKVLKAKEANTAKTGIYGEFYSFRFTVVEGWGSTRASSMNEATDEYECEKGDGEAIPNFRIGGIEEIIAQNIACNQNIQAEGVKSGSNSFFMGI